MTTVYLSTNCKRSSLRNMKKIYAPFGKVLHGHHQDTKEQMTLNMATCTCCLE